MNMSEELEEFLRNRVRNPRQKDFFDEHASTWDVGVTPPSEKIRYILKKAEVHDGMDILDVGTGTGIMIPYYLEIVHSGTVTGLDYSENMIAEARRKNPERDGLTYRVMDLYDLKDECRYDRVICFSCFPHFPDPLEAIRVLSRAVKMGGMFCVAHSDSADRINGVHRDGGEAIHMDRLPTMDLMREMYALCGLDVTFTRDDDDYYIVLGRKR